VIFNFSGDLPYATGPRISGGWNISYFDGIQTDYFVNRQVERNQFSVRANGKYRFTRRMLARASASFSDTDTKSIFAEDFSDTKSTVYAVGLERTEVLKGVNVYADYRLTTRESAGRQRSALDDTDESVVFGVNGQILPERLFPKLKA